MLLMLVQLKLADRTLQTDYVCKMLNLNITKNLYFVFDGINKEGRDSITNSIKPGGIVTGGRYAFQLNHLSEK